MKTTALTVSFCAALSTLVWGCSKKKSSDTETANGGATTTSPATTTTTTAITLPLLTPPVKAATPAGFVSSSLALDGSGSALSLDTTSYTAADIRSRFFSAGPTYLFSILGSIDSTISSMVTAQPACLFGSKAAAPVEYPVNAFGQTFNFQAQCYSAGTATATDPQLRLIGLSADGTTMYIYSADGAERVAAMVTPVTPNTKITDAPAGTALHVQVWIGVGYTNTGKCPDATGTWDSCSYGVIQIDAVATPPGTAASSSGTTAATTSSTATTFEMSVAGIGFGFCGIQLKSDGVNLYTDGSTDQGTCQASGTLCVLADDLTMAGNCTGTVSTFALPALGRMQAASSATTVAHGTPWGASTYPTTPNITLSGANTDSLWFGPTTAPSGVAELGTAAGGSTGTSAAGNSGGTSAASGT